MEAVILAGGLGTRLAGALPGVAKVLAPVKGRPFLDYVLEYLVSQGIQRIVLSVGHLQEQVIRKYRDFAPASLCFSPEPEPLGTGGAVRQALNLVQSDPFFVLNGDSLCRVDLSGLMLAHQQKGAKATLTLVRPDSRTDTGNVWLSKDALVLAFAEKYFSQAQPPDRFGNAGIYAFSKSVFRSVGAHRFSLEYDLLPTLVEKRVCYGFVSTGSLVDIGTADRLSEAQRVL